MADSPTGIEIAAAVAATAAVASAGVSAYGAMKGGQVGGDTAIVNSKLRARELIGQAQLAENQALIAERDAQMSRQAAASEREATALEVGRQREQGTAFLAQQRVEVAGAGLEATGSPLSVMMESAKQLELDRQAMTHAGEVAAREHEEQARMASYSGTLAQYQASELRKGIPLTLDIGRYQARAARQAGSLGAVSSLISGAAKTGLYGAQLYGNWGGSGGVTTRRRDNSLSDIS